MLLVDELNRATPRAQSALLEAMDESTVTVDGIRHPLPAPFFVVATQNPMDQYGTFPLPEGQLDRFAVALSLGPNDAATERRVMREQLLRATVDELQPVLEADELRWSSASKCAARTLLTRARFCIGGARRHPIARLRAGRREFARRTFADALRPGTCIAVRP